jgi:hypothetical protein
VEGPVLISETVDAVPSQGFTEEPLYDNRNSSSSPVKFNSDEFSSWLTDVEKRDAEKVVVARKYSAGLVTATSLDDSRIGGASVDEVSEETSTQKKKSKKKSTKNKSEKSAKKAASNAQTGISEKQLPVAPTPKLLSTVTKRLSETDHQLVLERELEDFLASDDE